MIETYFLVMTCVHWILLRAETRGNECILIFVNCYCDKGFIKCSQTNELNQFNKFSNQKCVLNENYYIGDGNKKSNEKRGHWPQQQKNMKFRMNNLIRTCHFVFKQHRKKYAEVTECGTRTHS